MSTERSAEHEDSIQCLVELKPMEMDKASPDKESESLRDRTWEAKPKGKAVLDR